MGKGFHLIQNSKKRLKKHHLTCQRSSSVVRWRASLKWGKAPRSNWNRVCHKTELQANVKTTSPSFYFPAFSSLMGRRSENAVPTLSVKASQSIEVDHRTKGSDSFWLETDFQRRCCEKKRRNEAPKKWDVTLSNFPLTSWMCALQTPDNTLLAFFTKFPWKPTCFWFVSGGH